jgi:hypothetical protein
MWSIKRRAAQAAACAPADPDSKTRLPAGSPETRSDRRTPDLLDAAILAALPSQTRQDHDHAAFAGTDIGILSIDDRVTHVYFHFVGAGRDHQNLRMIIARRRLSGLHAVDEHERSHRRAGHDDLCRVRRRRFSGEPTAGGKPSQCNQYEDSQWLCPRLAMKTGGYHAAPISTTHRSRTRLRHAANRCNVQPWKTS